MNPFFEGMRLIFCDLPKPMCLCFFVIGTSRCPNKKHIIPWLFHHRGLQSMDNVAWLGINSDAMLFTLLWILCLVFDFVFVAAREARQFWFFKWSKVMIHLAGRKHCTSGCSNTRFPSLEHSCSCWKSLLPKPNQKMEDSDASHMEVQCPKQIGCGSLLQNLYSPSSIRQSTLFRNQVACCRG